MPRPLRTATQNDLDILSRAYGQLQLIRVDVAVAGSPKAAQAISRAMRSLDGAIRHAQRAQSEHEDGPRGCRKCFEDAEKGLN